MVGISNDSKIKIFFWHHVTKDDCGYGREVKLELTSNDLKKYTIEEIYDFLAYCVIHPTNYNDNVKQDEINKIKDIIKDRYKGYKTDIC